MKKAVQQFMLGTVMGSEKQARETLRFIKDAGYDGIELCGFMIHPMGMAVRLLTKAAGMPVGRGGKLPWKTLMQESGLEVISLHLDLGTLERNVQEAAAEAKDFGTRYIVITGMYRFHYGSEENVRMLADRLNAAGESLRKLGIGLLYHNHNCELLQTESGKRAFDILMEKTNPEFVNFEFDSYWFAEAGADPLYWMKKLGSRMKLWHINDRGSRNTGLSMTPILKSDSMELGTGNMPLDALLEQAKIAGCESAILESHRNWIHNSPLESLRLSAQYLNREI